MILGWKLVLILVSCFCNTYMYTGISAALQITVIRSLSFAPKVNGDSIVDGQMVDRRTIKNENGIKPSAFRGTNIESCGNDCKFAI